MKGGDLIMILDKKSIFVVFMAIVLLSLSLVTASAIEDKSDLITPKFSHIDVFQNEFNISSSGKASILSYLNSDIAEQVRVTGYLQQYKDGGWQNVKSWTNSEYGTDVGIANDWYVVSGYTYRYVSYGYVYVDGHVVESTSYESSKISY
jgi:hypothetical protein